MMNANGSRIAISSHRYEPAGAAAAGTGLAVLAAASALPAHGASNRNDGRTWRGLGIIASLRVATDDRPAIGGAYRSRPAPGDKRRATAPAGPAA